MVSEVEHELHFLFNILIIMIVFDLSFTETLVIDTPFIIILITIKKPSLYLTMLILMCTDLHAYIHSCMEYTSQKLVL